MNILGVQYSGHDTSAALLCDGGVVAAAEEERFTRRKHESALPVHAIEFCLSRTGLRMSQVDRLAYPELPFRSGPNSPHAEMEQSFVKRMHGEGKIRYRSLVHKILLDRCLRLGIRFNWQMDPR